MVIRSIFHFSHTPEQMLMGLLSPSLYFLSSCLYFYLPTLVLAHSSFCSLTLTSCSSCSSLLSNFLAWASLCLSPPPPLLSGKCRSLCLTMLSTTVVRGNNWTHQQRLMQALFSIGPDLQKCPSEALPTLLKYLHSMVLGKDAVDHERN